VPNISPYAVCLEDADRAELESVTRRGTAPWRLALRARIVLLAAGGLANCAIAARLGICEDTARKWRRRYCELPSASGRPLARWTCPELARQAAVGGIVTAVSASTVRRWLDDDAIKPWQHRSWIFPRDPYFALKGGRVLDLYQRIWEGQPLGEGEHVLSADEKPGVQARMRIHLPLPPGPRRAMRAESEYVRCGTLAYLAAYDVHRAKVTGRCEPSTGIKPFTALIDQVMRTEPYASAKRVFWVVDNGASHRNWAAAARLSDACPNAQMVHLPVHASWLNQVEVYFSVIQRKLLTPDDFEDLETLAEQILAFEQHYNATARPFDWKFTRTDLNRLLTRLGKHDPAAPRPHAA
jgi:hypothetical protein